MAVQPLSASGQSLSTSATVAVPAHAQIFGSSVFVPRSGLAGVPVGCYSAQPCHLSVAVTRGTNLLARSGRQYFAAGTGGAVYFRLSGGARTLLAHSAGHRLGVQVTLQDASGAGSATRTMTLIPFSTSGAGPRRTYSKTAELRFVSGSAFVSPTGVGAVLAECLSVSPCHVRATISTQAGTLASTGGEYIGANQLGAVYFTLSHAGLSALGHASGNQLPVQVTLTGAGPTASAGLALIAFH